MDISRIIVSENCFATFDYKNKKIINGSREFIFEEIDWKENKVIVVLESGKKKDFQLSIFFDEATIIKIKKFVKNILFVDKKNEILNKLNNDNFLL